ncbi:hypothetical protein P3X46_010966 [Hevea brasiliensis]|uniref:DUF632 domain-containing protein n=1 Tax=Hevea brasiliensis TaxID=3981 RepID=A0ABQ9MFQ4_HEVBR|nr:protein ROLLING AND ERECT LEAF 2-like [Hevea brasiliensis]KAJ9179147.1 hypothetical protein P3X46_010966 [Hevea brasiliensis]
MGCTQSKIENEEAVSRCKERKQFMKDAVAARNAFASAYSAYAITLKNTGAALCDYTHASSMPSVVATSSTVEEFGPPPPPFREPEPLQRAATMPEFMILKPEQKLVGSTIMEDEEMEFDTHDNEKLIRKRSSSSNRGSGSKRGAVQENHQPQHPKEHGPPQPPQQQQQRWKEEVMRGPTVHQGSSWEEYIFPPVEIMPGPTLAEPVEVEEELRRRDEEKANKVSQVKEEEDPVLVVEEKVEKAVEVPVPVQVPAVEKKVAKKGTGEMGRIKPMSLMVLFAELDDHFLKASESAHEVSKMLEATRLHYHSNFADNRGHIDHSKRVMRVITWNRSFKGIPSVDDDKDDFDREEHETHATVLDKMLAWEKKLYDEVKAGEIMKFEYQRKVALLNKRKKQGGNYESLEKLKADVSHLHTRYIVDMQSLDSTVAEINRLRDEQLYPKLVQLVDGMAAMWSTMKLHHEAQLKLLNALKYVDISQSPKETSEYHYDRTCQLCAIVRDWHTHFCRLTDFQKDYIKALNNWLKLNLIPIESNLKEKVSSPPRVHNPPIHALLIAWHDDLEKLPDEVARSAIGNFAAVLQTIVNYQEEEMKIREKCEAMRKELARKTKQFDDWKQKHNIGFTNKESDHDMAEDNPHRDAMVDRQIVLDSLSKQLENEEEACQKLSLQARQKSFTGLKTCLPELFRAMTDIALACSEMYSHLRSIAQHRNPSLDS